MSDKETMVSSNFIGAVFFAILPSFASAQALSGAPVCPPVTIDQTQAATALLPFVLDEVGKIPNAVDRLQFAERLGEYYPETKSTAYPLVAQGLEQASKQELSEDDPMSRKRNLLDKFMRAYQSASPTGAEQLRSELAQRAASEHIADISSDQSLVTPEYLRDLKNSLERFVRSPTKDAAPVLSLVDVSLRIADFILLDPNQKKVTPEEYLRFLDNGVKNDSFQMTKSEMELNLQKQGFRPDAEAKVCRQPTEDTLPIFSPALIADSYKAAIQEVADTPKNSIEGLELATKLSDQTEYPLSEDEKKILDVEGRARSLSDADLMTLKLNLFKLPPEVFAKAAALQSNLILDGQRVSEVFHAFKVELDNCKTADCEKQLLNQSATLPPGSMLNLYKISMNGVKNKDALLDATLLAYNEISDQNRSGGRTHLDDIETLDLTYNEYLDQPCMTFEKGLSRVVSTKDPFLQAEMSFLLMTHFRANDPITELLRQNRSAR